MDSLDSSPEGGGANFYACKAMQAEQGICLPSMQI